MGARGVRSSSTGRAWARGRALQAARRAGVGHWSTRACAEGGVQAGAQAGAQGRARGSKGARGVWPGRWARGLGAWVGLGLCTWCTRPIFDPF